jgi:hypothetical protein
MSSNLEDRFLELYPDYFSKMEQKDNKKTHYKKKKLLT